MVDVKPRTVILKQMVRLSVMRTAQQAAAESFGAGIGLCLHC